MKQRYALLLAWALLAAACNPPAETTEEATENTGPATQKGYREIPSRLFLKSTMFLGEGASYDAQRGHLLWVEILEGKVSSYNLYDRSLRRIDLDRMVGTVVPYKADTVVAATEKGFSFLDFRTGQVVPLARPLQTGDSLRFNDGKCDPKGRFWAGAMHKKLDSGRGRLFRLDGLDSTTQVLDGLNIPNGIVWSEDGETMYFIDTPTRRVYAYDYELATGQISNRRVAVRIPQGQGSPDGMAIDAEGKLWVALWGGFGVGRFDPESGEMLAKVKVPAPNVTSCAFAGQQLDSLFITTARSGMTPQQLADHPKAGSLFLARPGVEGRAFEPFGGLPLLEVFPK